MKIKSWKLKAVKYWLIEWITVNQNSIFCAPVDCEHHAMTALFEYRGSLACSLYLNIYERPIPKWESSFQSNKIIGTSTLLGGKDWAGPFFPSSKMYWSIYLYFSLLNYAALSLHLNSNVWPVQKRESSFHTTSILVLLHYQVGKDWAGPIFPSSKIFLSFYLSFQSFGLCNSLTVSEQF